MLPYKLKTHDIFISYVVEDREIVEELYELLIKRGFRVWYANRELYIGANIRAKINSGLKTARYGLVLISPNYKSHWSQGELFSLMENRRRVLPILHNTTIEDVALEIPGIYDIFCLNTQIGTELVVERICKRIAPKSHIYYKLIDFISHVKEKKKKVISATVAILLLFCSIAYFFYYQSLRPSNTFISKAIEERKKNIETLANKQFEDELSGSTMQVSTLSEINRLEKSPLKSRYMFSNGVEDISSLASLKNKGILPGVSLIAPPYGISEYKAYVFKNEKIIKYGLVSLAPCYCGITDERLIEKGIFELDIKCENFLRYAEVSLHTDAATQATLRIVNLFGIKPHETMVFEEIDGVWRLIQIR
jgi:hypothetical protein